MLYSIVVPVYNSCKTLEELAARIRKTFESLKIDYELILVDDGSLDNSWATMLKLKKEFPAHLKIIRFVRNFGQHNALLCGIKHADGDFIITIDDDLQHPPEEMVKLIQKQEQTRAELVYGCYHRNQHDIIKVAAGNLVSNISKIRSKIPGKGSSFRLFTRNLGQQIFEHRQSFVYIDELLLWYTNDISFVTVEHHKRKAGKSGYSKIKLLALGLNLMWHYTAIPLKIMIYSGFFISTLSFFAAVYFILKKVLVHTAPQGYTSLIVAILFSTGIIVLSLGIIGEYMVRIYHVHNKKPSYAVKESVL